MKLVRFGALGSEKPGLIDSAGQIRDLSGHIDDINGAALAPASLDKIRAINPDSLPVLMGMCALGPVWAVSENSCVLD